MLVLEQDDQGMVGDGVAGVGGSDRKDNRKDWGRRSSQPQGAQESAGGLGDEGRRLGGRSGESTVSGWSKDKVRREFLAG